MKRAIIILIIATIVCGSAFASATLVGNPNEKNEGWWLGASGCVSFQGVGATYDFGAFDVSGDLELPFVIQIPELVANFSWRELLELFSTENIRVSGYYSLVDANWFTFNVGANLDILNYAYYYEDRQGQKEPGWGGACMVLLVPSAQLKFQISNKVMIKLSAAIPTPGGDGDTSLGLGTVIPYGNDNAQIGALILCVLLETYNVLNLSVQFKL